MISSSLPFKLPDISLPSQSMSTKRKEFKNESNPITNLDTTTKDDYNTLFEIKQKRKYIENNARILANRLKILKLEETKIRKNVEQIQKKTSNIIEHKAQKELDLAMKQSMSVDRIHTGVIRSEDKYKEDIITNINLGRHLQKERIKESINQLYNIKEFQKHKLKEILNNEHSIRRALDEEENKKKMERNLKVKTDEALALKRKKTFLNEKVDKIKDAKQDEIDEELETIQDLKKQIEVLGKAEDEMLTNINQVTNLQYQVFEKLNEAQSMPSDEALKHLNKSNNTSIRPKYLSVNRSARGSLTSNESVINYMPRKFRNSTLAPLKPILSDDQTTPSQDINLSESQSISTLKKYFIDIDNIKKCYLNANKSTKNFLLGKSQLLDNDLNASLSRRST